jgi:hypothetical protein
MFADLCYFSVRSVQVKNEELRPCDTSELESWCSLTDYYSPNLLGTCSLQLTFVCLVLPCLMLGYLGQAAYLIENPNAADQAFFSSIPSKLHWSISVIFYVFSGVHTCFIHQCLTA